MSRVAYVTDVEGLWEKLDGFARGNPDVSLDSAGRLQVAPGATFVFGGDAVDRGPAGQRIVATLLEAKLRQPERVVLLSGNRDLNKLRLARELRGVPPRKAPPEVAAASRPDLLRWIFERTMGASKAFECRRAELAATSRDPSDEGVVASYLAELEPDGPHVRFLAASQLAYRSGGTLFVHGAVTEENLGRVPDGSPATGSLTEWIDRLNAFHARGVHAFRTEDPRAPDPGWGPLVDYQAPLPGTRLNQGSVVYARPTDSVGNPRLPSPGALAWLESAGIHRVVVGHSPSGDCPAVLRGPSLELVLADNSYGRVEGGSQVGLDDGSLRVSGETVLDSGERLAVRFTLPRDSRDELVGRRDRETGRLVKARLERGDYLTFFAFEAGRVEQRALPAEDLAARPLVAPD